MKVERVIPRSGTITQVETELIVYVDRKEAVPVFRGPSWYPAGMEQGRAFKAGDKVTATGSRIASHDHPSQP
jgi:hypothetical protein